MKKESTSNLFSNSPKPNKSKSGGVLQKYARNMPTIAKSREQPKTLVSPVNDEAEKPEIKRSPGFTTKKILDKYPMPKKPRAKNIAASLVNALPKSKSIELPKPRATLGPESLRAMLMSEAATQKLQEHEEPAAFDATTKQHEPEFVVKLPPKRKFDPEAFKIPSKQKASNKRTSSLSPEAEEHRQGLPNPKDFIVKRQKPKLVPLGDVVETKDKFMKSRQMLIKFAPIGAEAEADAESQLRSRREEKVEITAEKVNPPSQSITSTPFLKQRSKIKLMRDMMNGKPDLCRDIKTPLAIHSTEKSLLGGFGDAMKISDSVKKPMKKKGEDGVRSPGSAAKAMPKSSGDPLSKVMKRFLQSKEVASPSSKPSERTPKLELSFPAEEKTSPSLNRDLIITPIKEVDEDEQKGGSPRDSIVSFKTTSGDSDACSLSKHRLMRSLKKRDKLHGIQPTIEKARQSASEATVLFVFPFDDNKNNTIIFSPTKRRSKS